MLFSYKIKSIEVNDAKFHHNTSYESTPSIIRYGILSLVGKNNLGISKYSESFLDKMSDIDSHVNDIDKISLSIVGLKDLDPRKFEYNPYNPNVVDLIISNDIHVRRSTHIYDNEFLYSNSITPDKIKSVDIRLLKLIEKSKNIELKDIIEKYNLLKSIALTIKELGLDISLREMSNENLSIDIDKISQAPKLILK